MSLKSVGVLLAIAPVLAAPSWRVTQGDVVVKCPMTVGGSFDAKTTALTGTSESGFTVDLRTLDTGIGLRNEHLREKYLEVNKGAGYDKAVLTQIVLKGINFEMPEGKGSFSGALTLHEVTKAVTGPVEVRKAGSALRVKASFPVHLPDYNIPEPRYLGVGVKDTVRVDVTFTTTE